jgi:predicted metal-binding membrane protein
MERIVRRDRLTTVIGLVSLTMLAWLYLVRESASMQSMAMDARMHAAMGMADMHAWSAADWLALFVMWTVMMAGMMLPSAAPVILLVLAAYRRRGDRRTRASSAAFIGGYLLAWTMFSGIAAAIQVGLHRTALLTPEMASGSVKLAGAILLMAGVYQWLPIKNRCLTHCQSPLGFITRYGAAAGADSGWACVMACSASVAAGRWRCCSWWGDEPDLGGGHRRICAGESSRRSARLARGGCPDDVGARSVWRCGRRSGNAMSWRRSCCGSVRPLRPATLVRVEVRSEGDAVCGRLGHGQRDHHDHGSHRRGAHHAPDRWTSR